jgi:hypothetical protein
MFSPVDVFSQKVDFFVVDVLKVDVLEVVQMGRVYYFIIAILSLRFNETVIHTHWCTQGGEGGTSCTPLKDSKNRIIKIKNTIEDPSQIWFSHNPKYPPQKKLHLWSFFRCRQRWRRGRSGGRSSPSDATDLIAAGGSRGFIHKRRSKGKKTTKNVLTLKNKKKNKERWKNDAKFIWSTESKKCWKVKFRVKKYSLKVEKRRHSFFYRQQS